MADLQKRQLGKTGLQVTMLGYGAMELRGAPRARDISNGQAETILRAVLDAGINYIDPLIDYCLSEGVSAVISRRLSVRLARHCPIRFDRRFGEPCQNGSWKLQRRNEWT